MCGRVATPATDDILDAFDLKSKGGESCNEDKKSLYLVKKRHYEKFNQDGSLLDCFLRFAYKLF